MIYSGVDWSGDTGDPSKSRLNPNFVVAVAHIGRGDLETLDAVLNLVRRERGLPAEFSFRYSSSSESVRKAFFRAMDSMPIAVRVSLGSKLSWPRERFRQRSHEVVGSLVANVLAECPACCIEGQIVRIDLSKDEMKAFREIESTPRQ